MKTATVHEIKQELLANKDRALVELCLRLAKFKKENKELLTYLLFEAHNEEGYIAEVKQLITDEFENLDPTTNIYFTKKSIRKILRTAVKHIRYTGSKTAEAAILIHFLTILKESSIPYQRSNTLVNMYALQLKKIKAALAGMHEDLQYDFKPTMEEL
ncbi:MAG: hypothetical protein RL596_2538 [Bacteroidota bacterium]|jgi:hypothetical protein